MPEEANRTRLIAIALQLVKNEDIENRPYFKGMSDDAIREFIAQYSPELVLNWHRCLSCRVGIAHLVLLML